MEKQMTAERNRRALILQAKATSKPPSRVPRAKSKRRLRARKAKRNRLFLSAEGAAQARLKAATADAQAIAQIAESIGNREQTTQYLITSRYIESLRDMTKTTTRKLFLCRWKPRRCCRASARSKKF
jgi:regulator of protease activity HflC (stomatin/prohibitin superfamily)